MSREALIVILLLAILNEKISQLSLSCLQVDVTERVLKTELESTKLNLHNEIIAKVSKTDLVTELLDYDARINSTNKDLVNQEDQLAILKVKKILMADSV